MVCVICLDEEIPTDMTPCDVCFNTKFHEECFDAYRRTRDVCPTCKKKYEQVSSQRSSSDEMHVTELVFFDNVRVVFSNAKRTWLFVQVVIIILTLAFVPRKDRLEFWTLVLTFLFLTWMHVFERVPSAHVFFAICSGICLACTVSNTILFNQDSIYVAYVGLTCMNGGIYAIRALSRDTQNHQIHPEQSAGASHQ